MNPSWITRLHESEDGRRLLQQERLITEVTETIAALLHEQQLSRSDLAGKLGKSPAFVTKLLRGNNNFTLRTVSDVFSALNRSAHLVVGESGENVSLCRTKPCAPLRLDSSRWQQRGLTTSWASKSTVLTLGESPDGDVAA